MPLKTHSDETLPFLTRRAALLPWPHTVRGVTKSRTLGAKAKPTVSGALAIHSRSHPYTPPVLAFICGIYTRLGFPCARRLAPVGSSWWNSQEGPAREAPLPPVSTLSALCAESSWTPPSGRLADTSSARYAGCTSPIGSTCPSRSGIVF